MRHSVLCCTVCCTTLQCSTSTPLLCTAPTFATLHCPQLHFCTTACLLPRLEEVKRPHKQLTLTPLDFQRIPLLKELECRSYCLQDALQSLLDLIPLPLCASGQINIFTTFLPQFFWLMFATGSVMSFELGKSPDFIAYLTVSLLQSQKAHAGYNGKQL